MSLNHEEKLRVLREDLLEFAPFALKIRTKEGQIRAFELNKAQRFIHKRLEEQRQQTGKVRALILKGRQQGCSTYVSARYFHRVIFNEGMRVFILTHERDATDNLFDMVLRYYQSMPEYARPPTQASNAKELLFAPPLDSGYRIGTAGNKSVGRSSTIQLFHGSEVAFWENEQEHKAGVMQAVPPLDNTEIILESTANGQSNIFYKMAMEAMIGESEYQLIFIPWYWQEEYTSAVPEDFALTEEEEGLRHDYDLTLEQLSWRRKKIKEFDDDVVLFKQEYPCNPIEAFQFSDVEAYIQPYIVSEARRKKEFSTHGPVIVGVDPARYGGDRTVIAFREGRHHFRTDKYKDLDTMEVAGRIVMLIKEVNPKFIFIDIGGLGVGIYDRLREMGYTQVIAVNFGGKPFNEQKYRNKRAELWGELKLWLKSQPCLIQDDDELQADLTSPGYKYDSQTRLLLESKEEMRKRGVKSPDCGDALALTFTFPNVSDTMEIQSVKAKGFTIGRRGKQNGLRHWKSI